MPAASRRATAARNARFVASVGNAGGRGAQLETLRLLQHDPVGEVNRLHHRRDLVIAVGAPPQHLEREIDLGGGAEHEATARAPIPSTKHQTLARRSTDRQRDGYSRLDPGSGGMVSAKRDGSIP